MDDFRRITPGIDTFPGYSLPRHRHFSAYATVVLSGSFEESGYAGRICARAGDVLIHPAMDCHANQVVSATVSLIRLDWKDSDGTGRFLHLDDVDELARVAERNPREASTLLRDTLEKKVASPLYGANDWPDLLANELAQDPSTAIGRWAVMHDLAPESVSRGFSAAYGISPTGFRAELRARTAWLRITRGADSLCAIAAETGFADQAHMTRWMHRIFGAPPAVWRRQSSPVRDDQRAR